MASNARMERALMVHPLSKTGPLLDPSTLPWFGSMPAGLGPVSSQIALGACSLCRGRSLAIAGSRLAVGRRVAGFRQFQNHPTDNHVFVIGVGAPGFVH